MNSKIKQPASAGRMPLLVRQVSKALKRTKGMMFWSVIIDEDDITDRLERHIAAYGDEKWAVESTIESVLSSHEETMKNAVQEQCHSATKHALESLPNASDHPTASKRRC